MSTDLALFVAQPIDRHPAAVYLASLSATGRRSMRGKLDKAARLLGFPDASLAPWAELRFQHIVAVRTKLLDEECLAPASVNAFLAALRGVARAAFNLGLMGADDYQRLKNVEAVRGSRLPAGRELSAHEINRLFRECAGGGAGGARDAAIIALLYTAGLRRAEVAELDLADYDMETGELRVRGKGNNERIAYIHGGARGYLGDWLERRGQEPGALLCPVDRLGRIELRRMTDQAVYNSVIKRARAAGVNRFSPHDLRRTFVSHLLDAGADIVTVQKLAGHAQVTTTARYDRRGEATKRRAAGLLRIAHYNERGEEGTNVEAETAPTGNPAEQADA